MLCLAINTATRHNALALLTQERVIAEETWLAAQNQAEILQPKIKELLQKNNFSWTDLTHVIVVKGPGAFTSLRVGVVAANAVAFALNKPIFAISTFELYQLCSPADAWLCLAAGKDKAYFTNLKSIEEKLYQHAEIEQLISQNNIQALVGDGPFAKTEVCSLGQALLKLDWAQLQWQKQVEPHYVQPANITMPCST